MRRSYRSNKDKKSENLNEQRRKKRVKIGDDIYQLRGKDR